MDLESYRLGACTSVVSLFRTKLVSEDPPKKEDPVPDAPQDQQAPSGLTYSLVTKYWPRVAAGLVALAALAEWIVGGLTSNGALESYVFAWAVTTAGLWFLFDKAEAAMSARSRKQVVRWMQETELRPSIESMPAQFALMFDKLFGERHWSRRRFNRSCWASAASVLFLVAVRASSGDFPQPIGGEVDGFSPLVATTIGTLFFLGAVVPFNFIPDYLSLVETRWAIRRMETKGRVPGTLVLDLAATALISFFGMLVVTGLLVLVSELLTSIMSLVAALGSDLYSYEPIARCDGLPR